MSDVTNTPQPLETNEPDAPEKKGGINVLILMPLIIFLALSGLFLWQMASGKDPNKIPSVLINKSAPEFDLPALDPSFGIKAPDGGEMPGFKTADFKGQISVVNVWGSWCPACRDEHPVLLEMTKDKRFELIGLAYKDQPANAARFLHNHGNPFDSVGLDISGRVGIDWGVYGAPETFIVDHTGTIRYKHIGPLSERSLAEVFMPRLEEVIASAK